jgi:hypothetical protein
MAAAKMALAIITRPGGSAGKDPSPLLLYKCSSLQQELRIDWTSGREKGNVRLAQSLHCFPKVYSILVLRRLERLVMVKATSRLKSQPPEFRARGSEIGC